VSLINRVLKDLEQRRAGAAGNDAPALPREVRAAAGARARRLPAYTWIVGLALILAALAWWWLDGSMDSGPAPDAARLTQPAAPAPPPAEPLPIEPVPTESAPTEPVQTESAQTESAPVESLPADPATAASAPLPAPIAIAPEPPLASAPAPVESPSAAAGADQRAPEMPVAPPPPRTPAPAVREPAGSIDEPAPAPDAGRIDKQVHPLSAAERAEEEFRRGMDLFRAGRADEAEAAWRAALAIEPAAAAPRQALLGALLERGERERAETLLQEGLRANPRQPKQTMLLARLQLDRGAQADALHTLEQGLPHAQWNAEYLSMTAAVMSRVGRHRDAADLYASALRIVPGNAVWEMGRGMALRADGQRAQALAAFRRASQMAGLSPELHAFVERQIRELQ